MLRYELAGLARKPLTEVVATAPLMAVLALTPHHAPMARVMLPAAVLAAAVRRTADSGQSALGLQRTR